MEKYAVLKTFEFEYGNRQRRMSPGEVITADECGPVALARLLRDGSVEIAKAEATARGRRRAPANVTTSAILPPPATPPADGAASSPAPNAEASGTSSSPAPNAEASAASSSPATTSETSPAAPAAPKKPRGRRAAKKDKEKAGK